MTISNSTTDGQLLQLELIVAAGLLSVSMAWDVGRGLGLWAALTTVSVGDIFLGLVAALPPLLIILLLELGLDRYIPGLEGLRHNIHTVLIPLVGRIRLPEAILVAALAGVSEEIFFRGVLQREVGGGVRESHLWPVSCPQRLLRHLGHLGRRLFRVAGAVGGAFLGPHYRSRDG